MVPTFYNGNLSCVEKVLKIFPAKFLKPKTEKKRRLLEKIKEDELPFFFVTHPPTL